ncbi:hypothetical protein BJ508DRAFT_336306 [Ascobolus immersus RN42]|uniref:Uncharacterized protein n=1 Tax=Ascobolus immersus RN42 TaxID=1160509 RepID=A0A3N4H8Z9_ASCIM|nr:hypothetical protein BJ508DRAFT_336306 [Ascobolus immersus RN42]
MVSFTNICLPDLWKQVGRCSNSNYTGPSQVLARCWLFLHNATGTHPPSEEQKKYYLLLPAASRPRLLLGGCTTCGRKECDTTIHGFLLCPKVQEAWLESAHYLDSSDLPNLPTTGVYCFLEPQHMATAFYAIHGNDAMIFKWWACTISAIHTRRQREFQRAKAANRDALVNYTGIAKDVRYLISAWPSEEPVSDTEDLIIYSTRHWDTLEQTQVGTEIAPQRKRNKEQDRVILLPPPTSTPPSAQPVMTTVTREADPPALAPAPALPPSQPGTLASFITSDVRDNPAASPATPYEKRMKLIVGFGLKRATTKSIQQEHIYTVRFHTGPDEKMKEAEIRKYPYGPEKIDNYNRKKNIV